MCIWWLNWEFVSYVKIILSFSKHRIMAVLKSFPSKRNSYSYYQFLPFLKHLPASYCGSLWLNGKFYGDENQLKDIPNNLKGKYRIKKKSRWKVTVKCINKYIYHVRMFEFTQYHVCITAPWVSQYLSFY